MSQKILIKGYWGNDEDNPREIVEYPVSQLEIGYNALDMRGVKTPNEFIDEISITYIVHNEKEISLDELSRLIRNI